MSLAPILNPLPAGPRSAAASFLAAALVALLLSPDPAAAQPCGGYEHVRLPRGRLDGWIAALAEADAASADSSATPSARIAAFDRIVAVEREIDAAYSLCDLPDPDDDDRFRAASGRGLTDGHTWRTAAREACARTVAETHASGEEARGCVREGARPLRPLAREAPAAWREAGADDGARIFEEMRAAWNGEDDEVRADLAAICLEATDWDGALDLIPVPPRTYEQALLRAAALAGRGDLDEANCAYRRMVRGQPGRPEAHFNLALVASSRWSWPTRGPAHLRGAFFHALAYLCLTDPADDPVLADEATDLARNLEEVLTGKSAWIWHGDEEPPPLPLPVEELGPESQGFPADTPHAHTCREVLREAAPGHRAQRTSDPP